MDKNTVNVVNRQFSVRRTIKLDKDMISHTWSLVLTTHSGLVVIAVAAPAPAAATMFAPVESWLYSSAA